MGGGPERQAAALKKPRPQSKSYYLREAPPGQEPVVYACCQLCDICHSTWTTSQAGVMSAEHNEQVEKRRKVSPGVEKRLAVISSMRPLMPPRGPGPPPSLLCPHQLHSKVRTPWRSPSKFSNSPTFTVPTLQPPQSYNLLFLRLQLTAEQ